MTAPARQQVKTALEWSRDEILIARNDLEQQVSALIEAFADGRFAEINTAAVAIRNAAYQIGGLAASLSRGCIDQMNRRPRP